LPTDLHKFVARVKENIKDVRIKGQITVPNGTLSPLKTHTERYRRNAERAKRQNRPNRKKRKIPVTPQTITVPFTIGTDRATDPDGTDVLMVGFAQTPTGSWAEAQYPAQGGNPPQKQWYLLDGKNNLTNAPVGTFM